MKRSKLLAEDIEKQNNIFALPQNHGDSPPGDDVSEAEPVEEENLRALLLDLRKDITALKKEQEDEDVAEPEDEEAHLYDLLASLKGDINVLKDEQKNQEVPTEEAKLFDMLSDLKNDIKDLKAEHDPVQIPEGEEHMYGLLVALKSDINSLKAEQSSPAIAEGEEHMYGLLAALKSDINSLKAEQSSPAIAEGEEHMYGLLAELKSDINSLKAEQSSPAIAEGEEHMYGLLAELKSDINVLKGEQDRHSIPEGEEHLYELLADLKGDIKVLKAETTNTSHGAEEAHLYGMLAELKQDINVLKHEHDVVPAPMTLPVVAPPRTSGWVYMLGGAFIVLMVLAAGAGGFYFSTYQKGTLFKIAGPAVQTKVPDPVSAPAPAPAPVAEVLAPKPAVKAAAPAVVATAPKVAVAEKAELRKVSGKPGTEVELKINMTGADIKPETAIVLVGIPEGFNLSAGKRTEEGEWVMTVWDTLRLNLSSPEHYEGDFDVTVSLMDTSGDLTTREKFSVGIAKPVVVAKASEGAVAEAAKSAPAPASAPVLTSPEQKELIERANQLIDQGDIVSARNVLDYAVSSGSAAAAFKLAQTYDPFYLGKIKSVLGVKPDLVKAKVLYYFAARNGHEDASKRLSTLRKESGTPKP